MYPGNSGKLGIERRRHNGGFPGGHGCNSSSTSWFLVELLERGEGHTLVKATSHLSHPSVPTDSQHQTPVFLPDPLVSVGFRAWHPAPQ